MREISVDRHGMAAEQVSLPSIHLESQVHIVDGQLQAVQHNAAQLPA